MTILRTSTDTETTVTDGSKKDFPKAPFVVVAKDTFFTRAFSGVFNGREHWILLTADSYEEAEIVADNLSARDEMRRVRIVTNGDGLKSARRAYSVKSKADAAVWYEKGSQARIVAEAKARRAADNKASR